MTSPVRDSAIEELFTAGSVAAFASDVTPALIAELRAEEEVAIAPMAAARQAEFATARACARAALDTFGVHAAVPRQDGGAPLWPAGMTGSISHTRGFCVAVACEQRQFVGIDVEEIGRMKPAVERRILVDAERARLRDVIDDERRQHVATIFAAKEAFYKAHYEVDPRYLGFDAVEVMISADAVSFAPSSGAVDASLLERTRGRVRIDRGRVIVGVSIVGV